MYRTYIDRGDGYPAPVGPYINETLEGKKLTFRKALPACPPARPRLADCRAVISGWLTGDRRGDLVQEALVSLWTGGDRT